MYAIWYDRAMSNTPPVIHFEAATYSLEGQTILRLPSDASKALSSRGQVAVTGTISGHEFLRVLEPDGDWGHWMRIDAELQKAASIRTGDTVVVEVTPTKNWPEPTIPQDFKSTLDAAPQRVKDKWHDITAMARWEWIRWVNATGNHDTRAIRIEKSMSKLNGTHRRPCCFNLAACTDPSLSKSGRLLGIATS